MSTGSDNSIWIVTNVPFWKRENGSHQRILALTAALSRASFAVTLWFVGPFSTDDRRTIEALKLFEAIDGPALPPRRWSRRIGWRRSSKRCGPSETISRPEMPQ